MEERVVLHLWLLLLLVVTFGHADTDRMLTPNETNIIAFEKEKAVFPCKPTSSKVNITLHKGEFSWSMKRIYEGKQPYRSQVVTFDPNVGFILDPVAAIDTGTFRCKAIDGGLSNSTYPYYYDRSIRWLGADFIKFSLDVNTGHLLVTPPNNTIIVKEGSEAVLPCQAVDPNVTLKLYKESFNGFEPMTLGKIRARPLLLDDDDDDSSEEGGGDDDVEDENRFLKLDKRGFVFSTVLYSDDDTYKCEARKQYKQEVMYFYMHVDEAQILRGTQERYITVYKGDKLVIPCKPFHRNVTVKLYHTSDREILVGPGPYPNKTVVHDPNEGFVFAEASTSDAGSYRCDASLKRNSESAHFYVYVNDAKLLEPVTNTNIHADGSGNTVVIPCIGKNSSVKVELRRLLLPEIYRVIPQRGMYGPTAVYDQSIGFTMRYSSHTNSEHLLCVAQLGKQQDRLFFYWHGDNLLLHPSSFYVVADAGDEAVLPCRPTDVDIDVKLYIGASYYKRREIKIGQQPHRNQTVTFDPAVGFTLFPVNHHDSSRYMCLAKSDELAHYKNFQLDVREPPRIHKTNLSVNKSLEVIAGHNMTVHCKSEGAPFPVTLWFKDDKPVVLDNNYELNDANQSLTIKIMMPEHGGTYSCLVRNELGEETAKWPVTVTVAEPIITRTNLNKSRSVMTGLKGNLTIFCESQGDPEPSTVWFKDGKPVIMDANVELRERNQSLAIKVVNVEHTGLYCCKVSNTKGEVQSEGNVTLADTEPVSVTDTNLNVTVNYDTKLGETEIIFCKPQGKPEPTVEWFKDGKPLVCNNRTLRLLHRDQELYIVPMKFEHAGTYRCVVTNGLTTAYAEGNVTVEGFFSEPAKIIETNMNVSHSIATEAGTDLVMFCKAEGNPLPNITWFKDDKPLDIDSTVELKDNNQTLTIKGVKQETAGKYRCLVQNQVAAVQMVADVNVTDDSANSTPLIVTSIVCILVLLAMVAALIFYIQRRRLVLALRQYMRLNRSREETEERSDFSDRLQEEYLRSPRAHGGDNEVGNLIVSECLPETSRPTLHFSDDHSNVNSVNRSSETGSFMSPASGVRSVELKSV